MKREIRKINKIKNYVMGWTGRNSFRLYFKFIHISITMQALHALL